MIFYTDVRTCYSFVAVESAEHDRDDRYNDEDHSTNHRSCDDSLSISAAFTAHDTYRHPPIRRSYEVECHVSAELTCGPSHSNKHH